MMDFLPMGFQYYRAPTPLRKNWETDLKKIREDGFNTVKFWAQWRWNEPREGRYDFSDLDELMDLAADNGLKVVLNLILDVAPVWLFNKYPDAVMITNGGERMEPRATEYRQIGGVPGPCFHHRQATELRKRFVEACAAHFADHPALWVWDVWNEPELSVGLKREPKEADLLCYCPESIRAFREWLARKYGDIETLNTRWGRNYSSFGEVEPARRRGTTMDMIDWRMFFNQTLTEDFSMRIQAVKKFDLRHPVMCHTVPPPLFNGISCCSDDFAMGAIGDMFGNSVGSSALASNLLKSAAKGKTVINSEIHAVYGSSLNGFYHPDFNDMLRHIFVPMTNGVKGWLLWQYRPEILGSEAPAWGNVSLKGEDTPWNRDLKKIHAFLKQYEAVILKNCPKRGKAGIYLSKESEIYSWIATYGTEVYNQSLLGAYALLRQCNRDVEFFTDAELTEEGLGGFDFLCFPAAFCMTPEKVVVVEEFAKNGGTAMFEAFAGMIDLTTGMHADSLPGCGLTDVCGLELEAAYSSSIIDNAYNWKMVSNSPEEILLYAGEEQLSGWKHLLRYRLGRAEVLAEFTDRSPAIFSVPIGKGRMIHAATLFFSAYERYHNPANLRLMDEICPDRGIPSWKKQLPLGLRGDCIGEGQGFIVLENTTVGKLEFSPIPGFEDDVFQCCEKSGDRWTLDRGKIAVFCRSRS